jgi:hypothetical protein
MSRPSKAPAGPKAEQPDPPQKIRPYNTQLRLNLNLLIHHFNTGAPDLPITLGQLERSDGYMRRILSATTRDLSVRYAPSSHNRTRLTPRQE